MMSIIVITIRSPCENNISTPSFVTVFYRIHIDQSPRLSSAKRGRSRLMSVFYNSVSAAVNEFDYITLSIAEVVVDIARAGAQPCRLTQFRRERPKERSYQFQKRKEYQNEHSN